MSLSAVGAAAAAAAAAKTAAAAAADHLVERRSRDSEEEDTLRGRWEIESARADARTGSSLARRARSRTGYPWESTVGQPTRAVVVVAAHEASGGSRSGRWKDVTGGEAAWDI